MPFSSIVIANAILDIAWNSGSVEITQMKLQRLVLLAHGWHLATTGIPLLDERVKAREYGPVIESIADACKIWGNAPITRRINNPQWELSMMPPPDTLEFLKWIWRNFGYLSAAYLTNLTHAEGAPWRTVYETELTERGYLRKGTNIPEYLIKHYFEQQLKIAQEVPAPYT